MTDAILVNPHSSDEVAFAIETALEMPLDERKRRWSALFEGVAKDNVRVWASNFVRDLTSKDLPTVCAASNGT